MNRIEALAALKDINTTRTTVQGVTLGVGFFMCDAIRALGDFERASRTIRSLTNSGRVNCRPVDISGLSHDLYFIA